MSKRRQKFGKKRANQARRADAQGLGFYTKAAKA